MVEEVSYGYPHGKMSSICLKFNALCNMFDATKGKVSTELHRVRPLSSSPLPYAVIAPTLFEFDPIKSSSPLD